MPNHIHGVLIITQNENTNVSDNVETGHAPSLQNRQNDQPNNQQPKLKTIGQRRFQNIGKNSLSSIIGSYKSAVTKHAHRLGFDFEWQTRFYEHIIRNNESFQNISNYIFNNPANWQEDKFFNAE